MTRTSTRHRSINYGAFCLMCGDYSTHDDTNGQPSCDACDKQGTMNQHKFTIVNDQGTPLFTTQELYLARQTARAITVNRPPATIIWRATNAKNSEVCTETYVNGCPLASQ